MISKKYFYISLLFNIAVILSFLFFNYVAPGWEKNVAKTETDLSPRQAAKIDSLKKIRDKLSYPYRLKIIEERLALWKDITEERVEETGLMARLDKIIALEDSLKIIRYRYWLKEQLILTPQQRREKYIPLIKQLEKRYREIRKEGNQFQ